MTTSTVNALDTHLDRLEALVAGDLNASVEAVIREVLALGLILTRGGQVPTTVRGRLQSVGSSMAKQVVAFTLFIARWEQQFFGEWTGDWVAACEVRSGLELLVQLFADTEFGRALAEVEGDDFEDVDAAMRSHMTYESIAPRDRIPADLPADHWWWFEPTW